MSSMMPDRIERLLDDFKRYSQQAGIAQQKAAMDIGPQAQTAIWLDKAEDRRTEILARFREARRGESVTFAPNVSSPLSPTTDGTAR